MDEHTPSSRRVAVVALIAAALSPSLAGCASAPPATLPPLAASGVTVAPSAAPAVYVFDGFARPEQPGPGGLVEDEADAWTWHAQAFLWVPGIEGKAGKGGAVGRPDMSVGDTADVLKNSLERALLTHVATRADGWGMFGEIIALKLEEDGSTARVLGPVKLPNGRVVAPRRSLEIEADATLKMTIAELGATYDLTGDLVADEDTDARIEALAGARYYDAELDLEVNGRRLSGEGGDWVDGFVGARALVALTDSWDVVLRGDVGGGGFGTSSDLAWRATGLVRWRASETVGVFGGWHMLDIDNERGSGASKQVFDLRLSGPVLGVTIDF